MKAQHFGVIDGMQGIAIQREYPFARGKLDCPKPDGSGCPQELSFDRIVQIETDARTIAKELPNWLMPVSNTQHDIYESCPRKPPEQVIQKRLTSDWCHCLRAFRVHGF